LKWQLDYIQVPVLLKLNIIPAGPIRPFICAGGYGAYLIKAKGIMTVDGVPEGTTLTADYQKYDYGVVGGAGLTFKLPGIAISVEGRYNYGLKNILVDPAAGDSLKNTSMMVLVGIGF
ncbi:MAG: PorT family protein, partial [Candidatus Aminicenantes bacterium]